MTIKEIKHRWNTSPIKQKLAWVIASVSTLAVFLMVLMLSAYHYHDLKRDLRENVTAQSHMLVQMIAPALLFEDAKNANELLSTFKNISYILHADVRLKQGHVFANYVSDQYPHPADTVATTDVKFNQLRLVHPILVDGEHLANLDVLVSLNELYITLLWFLFFTVIASLCVIGVSLLIGQHLVGYISNAIVGLTDFVRKVAIHHDYDAAMPAIQTQDELGDLSQGFSFLLQNLQEHETKINDELSRRQEAEKKFELLAMYDNVTGLSNRNNFYLYLQELINGNMQGEVSFYLMFVDLDDFKIINDTFGHRAGDGLLNVVGQRVSKLLLQYDGARLFRIGGDEFAIVITSPISMSSINELADSVINALNQPIKLDDNTGYIGGSVGICHYPRQASNYTELLSRADAAMYQAKSNSKNCYVHFNEELAQKIMQAQQLEFSLRSALEQNQFELYYQPIVDLQMMRIVGFEALIRWNHPEYGQVSPALFIPILEKTGLIIAVGNWVMATAYQQIKVWSQQFNTNLKVAVNVSGRQFNSSVLLEQIEKVIASEHSPLGVLHVELTENILLDDTEVAIHKMEKIKSLGISLSLDDFGTGFSSLSYLKRLPINCLKIDRSFIKSIPDNHSELEIVRAIVTMAEALNIRVVVEGIETHKQLSAFSSYKGIEAQGFLMSKPLPANQIDQLLLNTSPDFILNLDQK